MEGEENAMELLEKLSGCISKKQNSDFNQTMQKFKPFIPEVLERLKAADEMKRNFDALSDKTKRLQLIMDSSNIQLKELATTQFEAVKKYQQQQSLVMEQEEKIQQLNKEIQQLNLEVIRKNATIDSKTKNYMQSMEDVRNELLNAVSVSKHYQTQTKVFESQIEQLNQQIQQLQRTNQTNIQNLNQQIKQTEENYQNIIQQTNHDNQKQNTSNLQKVQELQQKLLDMNEQKNQLLQQLDTHQKLLNNETNKLNQQILENKRLQKMSAEELDKKQAEIERLHDRLDAERLQFKERMQSFEDNHLDKAVRRAQHLETRLQSMKEVDQQKEIQISTMLKDRQELEAKIRDQNKQIAELLEDKKNREDRKADDLQILLVNAKKDNDFMQKQFFQTEQENKRLKAQLEQFSHDFEQLKRTIPTPPPSTSDKQLQMQAKQIRELKDQLFKLKLLHDDDQSNQLQAFQRQQTNDVNRKALITPMRLKKMQSGPLK